MKLNLLRFCVDENEFLIALLAATPPTIAIS